MKLEDVTLKNIADGNAEKLFKVLLVNATKWLNENKDEGGTVKIQLNFLFDTKEEGILTEVTGKLTTPKVSGGGTLLYWGADNNLKQLTHQPKQTELFEDNTKIKRMGFVTKEDA